MAKSTIDELVTQARLDFQKAIQSNLLDLAEKLDVAGAETSIGNVMLQEAARFLGDTLYRLFKNTPAGDGEQFTTKEEVSNWLWGESAREAGDVFASLLGDGPLEVQRAVMQETPTALQ